MQTALLAMLLLHQQVFRFSRPVLGLELNDQTALPFDYIMML